MSVKDVTARLAEIQKYRGDWESFHSEWDSLWEDVLTAIADGTASDPAAIARAALNIEGIRWYA